MLNPIDPLFYDEKLHRLDEELEKNNLDRSIIKRLGVQSFFDFLKRVAAKLDMAFDAFMELFGPLFRD